MKPILVLLICWMLIPFAQLSAQLDTFDLSKYRLPDIKRRQLDFNTSTQLSQSWDNTIESKRLDWNGDLSTTYTTFTNNKKYQGSSSVSLSLNPNNTSSSYPTQESKQQSLSSELAISSSNRFFIKDQLFVETSFQALGLSNTYSNYYANYDNLRNLSSRLDEDNTQTNGDISANIYVGKGRIEPVEDARLALYILQDLQKINSLTRVPSNEEILEFSTLISQLKNKRFFDYRLRKIEELKELDSFLRSKGLIKEDNISYFAAVNDNWDYSSGPARFSGSKLYAGIRPVLNLESNLFHYSQFDNNLNLVNSVTNHVSNQQLELDWIAGYQCYKPVKLYWQFQYGAIITYSSSDTRIVDKLVPDTSKIRLKQFRPEEFAGLGYYPNSRTSISAGISFSQNLTVNYSLNTINNTWIKGTQANYYSAGLFVNFNYYISPQLSFNGNWRLNSRLTYNKAASTKRNSFDQNLNLTFIYSIF